MRTTWIFCTGMRRSASAWQFKTVCNLLPGAYDLGFIAHNEFDEYFNLLNGSEPCVVVKSHAYLPDYSNMEELFREGNTAILHTIRDPRDVIASLKRMWLIWGHLNTSQNVIDTSKAIISESESWLSVQDRWGSPTLLQRYEKIVSNYHNATEEIYEFLRYMVELDPINDLGRIAEENKPGNIGRMNITSGKSGRVWLHEGHVGNSRVGKWKGDLRDSQIEIIESITGDWMKENGYV